MRGTNNTDKLTYITLFSSAGVGCFGFKMAGYECIATNELIPRRLEIQKFNNKCKYDTGYICGDITKQETKDILFSQIDLWKKKDNLKRVDVLIATPPCQGMSVANHKKAENEIIRNSLVVESIKIIKEVNPKFFIFENVPAFMKTICTDIDGNEKTISEAIENNLGEKYSYISRVINFKNYGACSSRQRTLVIGVAREFADEISPIELYPEIEEEKTLRQVIGNLKSLDFGEIDTKDFYHAFRTYPEHMRAWIHDLKEGESAFDNKDIEKRPHQIKDGKIVENTRKNADKIEKKAFYSIDNLELVYFNAKDCELISGDSSSELGTFENSGKNVSDGVKFIIGNKAKKVPDNFLCADTWQSTTCEKTLIKEILFEENSVCEEIGNYSFSKQNLSNFDYPNTVVKLGKSAFENCKISSNKLVHNNLQYIGDLCFGESSFEEVELPESVTYLGYGIFYNNETLKTIRIKCNADTESSLENMFSGRSPYRGAGTEAEGVDFIIGSKVKKITADVFSDYGVYPKSFTFEDGSQLETIGKRAFKKVSAVGNISFPNTLKRIEEYAFSECINFNTESFPSSLEFIGLNAFANCTALTCKKPIVSDTLTIEANAFEGCTNMQE